MEQVPDLDLVLVPISGGGMTAGIATAVKTINPQCKVKLSPPDLLIIATSSGVCSGARRKESIRVFNIKTKTLVQPSSVPQHHC